MKRLLKYGLGILAVALLVTLSAVFAPPDASAAGTTSLTVKKLASDGTTVLDQKTVTWQELAAGVLNDGTPMPILGDGVTHYYHQGPIFEDDPALRWNPAEDFNWYGNDFGALRGTNVKDLCDLVGGMSPGEEVKVKSSDGWNMKFAYDNVYEYPSRTGPMVVTWEMNGMNPETGYNEGMRLVWFAEATWKEATDTSIGDANPEGMYHVFGIWDWHESAAEKYWYYYSGIYPTTTGLSGKVVSELTIYSDDPVPLTPPALTADTSDNAVGQAVDITFTDDANWRAAISDVTVNGTSIAGQYTVAAGNLNITAGVFTAAGDYSLVVKANGYNDAIISQTMAAPAAPELLSTEVTTKGDISLTFDKAMADPTGIGAEEQFEVFVDGNEVDVTAVVKTNTAEKIKLEMATDIVGGQTVTAAYTKSADESKQIKSTDGGVLETFSAVNVTNSLPVAPAAAFSADKTSGTAPFTVNFTDASTGTTPLTWSWDFNNDGTVDSTVQNPAYQYSAAGTYSVKLTVTNAAGSDDEVKTDYITVSAAPVAPAAAFTADQTSGTEPLTVSFTDQSTGTMPLTWAWDFDNDGTTDSTEQNPSYQYAEAGTYSVKLTVTNDAGSDDETKTDYITVSPALLTPPSLTADTTGNEVGQSVEITFTDDAAWRAAITDVTVGGTSIAGQYTVGAGTISINASVFATAGDYAIVVKATGYTDATVTQTMVVGSTVFTVAGNAVTPVSYTMAELKAMTSTTGTYTSKTGDISCTGVALADLLTALGVSESSLQVQINTTDAASYPVEPVTAGYMLDLNNRYLLTYDIDGESITGDATPLRVYWTGKVIKNVYGITIDELAAPPSLTADTTDNEVGQAVEITFTDDAAWRAAITGVTVGGISIAGQYTVGAGIISIDAGVFTTAGDYTIMVKAAGYTNATVIQTMDEAPVQPLTPPGLSADTTDNTIGQAVEITFTDDASWRAAITDVTVGGTSIAGQYTVGAGTMSIDAGVFTTAGDYAIVVKATGYTDATVTQTMSAASPTMDVLYDGTVNLTPGETFNVTAYYLNSEGTSYTVSETTPLGALEATGLNYAVSDKKYTPTTNEVLLLNDIGNYTYDSPGKWYAYVNNDFKDGFDGAAYALNLIELVDGDSVEFYYAAGIADETDLDAVKAAATAAVKTVASTGVTPTDWTLQLSGAKNQSVTKSYFEDGLACSSSSHYVTWTDADKNVWGGVPLWLLVGMVDDDPDVGPYHFNFNDDLAAQNYEVNVIAGDGFKATLQSAAIARNDGYIVANTLNGNPLPLQTAGGKPCWPLHLKGSAVLDGDQVGKIVRIELSGLPQPPEGWTLEMVGEVGDTITQEEFEGGLACTGSGHLRQWTDINDNVWSGVPLWVLLGAVDDIETSSHWTFNDDLAAGYTVNVVAGDYSRTFAGADVAGSDDYIVANKMNGADLTDGWPLRLVGNGVTKLDGSLGGASVANIDKIEIPELMTPEAAPESWNLALNGKISDVISQAEFEDAIACPNSGHNVEWTDADNNVWSGIPLWFLAGWVDDRQPHDYDVNQAMAGYTVLVKAGDGYTREFASTDIAWSNDYIIANKINGEPLDKTSWPLRLVGDGVAADGVLSGTSVRSIAKIELTAFNTTETIPELHIIKYAEDRTTIIDEMTVDYQWMQENLDVIGDGTTVYRYEAITNNPDDVWNSDEKDLGDYKIENAVKGTRIRDLCELVGGMGAGTEIVLKAKDKYETTLPYSSIYTDPSVQGRQGDAVLAWWADGKYVPYYTDGMRLFFMPDDHLYSQWDMHETLTPNYWHYYYSDGVQYPSCAGLSAKYIEIIKIYSVPAGDWTLELDGQDIGGLQYDVSKTYFESALACQWGLEHGAEYTDTEGQVWKGMPLWFLAGFVDDADQHSNNAFNDALAQAGYHVVITSSDGSSVTINSADIIRNNNYIVANTLNGVLIPDTDSSWPLRLVGPAVDETTSISKIMRIELVNTPSTELPVAAFTGTPTSGEALLTVQFTDQSTNTPTSWAWDFDNDGSVDSTEQNPSYEYSAAGTFSVRLTVTNSAGSDDEVKADYITVSSAPIAPEASFTADTTSGEAPLTVQFTDQSTNTPTSWSWDFDNDGLVDSTEQNPSYEYNEAGTYSVKLTVTNSAGSDDVLKTGYITVSSASLLTPPALTADTTDNTVGKAINITFTDNVAWRRAVAGITVDGTALSKREYKISKGKINIAAGVFTAAGDYGILVSAAGYEEAGVSQSMETGAPPVLNADTSNNTVGQAIVITFKDNAAWRAAVTDITVGGNSITGNYTIAKGKIRIAASVFSAAGEYEISVLAGAYDDTSVIQTINNAKGKKK